MMSSSAIWKASDWNDRAIRQSESKIDLDDLDAFVDLGSEPAEAQPAAEPAIEANGSPCSRSGREGW